VTFGFWQVFRYISCLLVWVSAGRSKVCVCLYVYRHICVCHSDCRWNQRIRMRGLVAQQQVEELSGDWARYWQKLRYEQMLNTNIECVLITTLFSLLLLEIVSGTHVGTTVYSSLNICSLAKTTVTTHASVLDFHCACNCIHNQAQFSIWVNCLPFLVIYSYMNMTGLFLIMWWILLELKIE
jgi:hypothetical protein